jgi:hypothetical protein
LKVPPHTAFKVSAPAHQARLAACLMAGLCLATATVRAETGTTSKPPAKVKSAVHANHMASTSAAYTKLQGADRRTHHSTLKTKSTRNSRGSQSRDARRRSAMRPEAQRVKEIQKALIEAGDLHQEPTGMWDDVTREAMKHYQQGHGFAPTGLPDSKSLMKMGLGPHPLPPDVATPAATSASLDPTVAPAPLSGPSDDRPAATVDPPQ